MLCAVSASARAVEVVDSIRLTDRQFMYYEIHGDGTPVLLIHGHTLDRRMWNAQVEPLVQAGYKVIMPDMRGYGLSSDPEEGQAFTHTDDMVRLLDSLNVGQAHIVGLSLGAAIAGELMILHPDRCLSCMMIGGEPFSGAGPHTPRSAQDIAKKKQDIAKMKKKDLDAYRRSRANSLVKIGGSHAEDMREEITKIVCDWGCWQPLHVTTRIYYASEAWNYLKDHPNAVRTMLVYGDKDYKSYKTCKYKSDTKTEIVPDCGHMVNMERPDCFNPILLEWLAE